MATMVRHKKSGELFVVIGSGYSAHWSKGGVLNSGEPEPHAVVFRMAVCSEDGRLWDIDVQALEVVSVDGRPIAELFSRESAYRGA